MFRSISVAALRLALVSHVLQHWYSCPKVNISIACFAALVWVVLRLALVPRDLRFWRRCAQVNTTVASRSLRCWRSWRSCAKVKIISVPHGFQLRYTVVLVVCDVPVPSIARFVATGYFASRYWSRPTDCKYNSNDSGHVSMSIPVWSPGLVF